MFENSNVVDATTQSRNYPDEQEKQSRADCYNRAEIEFSQCMCECVCLFRITFLVTTHWLPIREARGFDCSKRFTSVSIDVKLNCCTNVNVYITLHDKNIFHPTTTS